MSDMAVEASRASRLPFRDRDDAARQMAAALAKFRGKGAVVLAIPRGAVPMGRVVADAIGGELDVVLVRKLGAPGDPEFAIGAVDEQGRVTLNEYAARAGADEDYALREARRQLALIRERRAHYRPGTPPLPLAGRTVIVLDDGLATGSTMIAALQSVRAQQPRHLVCAVPVAAEDSLAHVSRFADEVVCLATPRPFNAVGLYYRDFSGVSDEEVIALLATPASGDSANASARSSSVLIPAGAVQLEGDLAVPPTARGLVLFAHGSGSSRHSPRNRQVAAALQQRGIATLLFDLLTPAEDRDHALRFDIGLLARRLEAGLQWVRARPELGKLRVGLFGASTGAAAALLVAAAHPGEVAAVVSRGGRPDLAGPMRCSQLLTPVLLIVGGDDTEVLRLNQSVRTMLGGCAELAVVPGATHLFEEAGTLEQAASLASEWFERWFGPIGTRAAG